ncbi:MAG TPA: type II secretion system F family protein [Verrucomicrobiae bacterium]|nr:type II secretion system F family protein [Verrucomicrobiae bacterium]
MFVNIPILLADESFEVLAGPIFYFLFVLMPVFLLAWLVYYLLSLPMRRQERARFFLDLLATTLRMGRPLEQSLIEIGNSRDRSPGIRFHLVAAHLERGLRLGEALKKVPRFLTPQVAAMLRAGEEMGDIRKVLPVCDYLVKDAQSRVRGAISYLVVIAFALSPFSLFVLYTLSVMIFPRFKEIIQGMSGTEGMSGDVPFFDFLDASIHWLMLAQAVLFAGLLIAAVFYVGGPRLARWLQFDSAPFVDWLAWRVPWKRRRLQRNFSMMLAILLDNGVPEAVALRLAGESTANEILRRRAARAGAALAQGTKLTEAVAALDASGEFRWRLANAVHARGGFLRALTGWHESLDAKAFQEEQAVAHTVTSGLVIANGLIVALVAIGIFSALISIINAGVLW